MTDPFQKLERKKRWKKRAKIALGATLFAGAAVVSTLAYDYFTKRLDIPSRNVLYTASQEVTMSGGEKEHGSEDVDTLIITQIYKGSPEGLETKVRDVVATTERIFSDDKEHYHLKEQDNLRIANANMKKERMQGGLRLSGKQNFQESYGVLENLDGQERKINPENEDAFLVYIVEPERAHSEIELNVLKMGEEKRLVNRLTDKRTLGIGWLWGKEYRAGTSLERFDISNDDPRLLELFKLISEYNTHKDPKDQKEREKIVDKIVSVQKSLPIKVVYKDFEDGIIDYDFQESTMYLGYNPSLLERMTFESIDFLEQTKELLSLGFIPKKIHKPGVIRIENHYDFFPGNIPFLKNWKHKSESGERFFSLFDKTNNGGYEIKDNIGTIAMVEIEDFALKYDTDTVYKYYLDKDGDGKIDREKDLISMAVVRISYGQKEDKTSKDESIGKEENKKDITFRYDYIFMGGHDTDPEQRYKDFLLATYMESMMPDQLNRGYGKHSKLGYINEARSDIVLHNDRRLENLSRALTEECALVAAHDIYEVLKAAKRPYAEQFAKNLGLDVEGR